MNKKTGEFSAADVKRAKGRKPPKETLWDPNGTKKRAGFFVCGYCHIEKPDEQVSPRVTKSPLKSCIACGERADSIRDGTFRNSHGRTHESASRASAKAHTKVYKSARLPKWMFS